MTANPSPMQRKTVTLGHRERGLTAQVWVGGEGPPLVLLHGAWAGARAHWSPVWDELARTHTVIAPELPGFFPGSGESKSRYAEYADWVSEVIDVVVGRPATVIGNSFGACIAWHVAALYPDRCHALVLVDGGPPPPLPGWMRWLLVNTPLHRVAATQVRERVFRSALATGFSDPARAPIEVRRSLQTPDLDLVQHLVRLFIRSTALAAPPRQPALVLWGAQDRLPQSDVVAGQRVHEQLPGSAFTVIDDAGHLPQLEQPERFVQALAPFLLRHGTPA
ncbi:alpha/beta fold hydrolase [Ideonella sp. BN130291]|uniref:alpha/beta fold hydrolase n=1 Tax=Ideonella sp. BN130291 TaxID=3112940 RepID=UPI002E261974|nr:alpha/beta hydrolase [Ideonella sp. BN130291]